MGKIESLIKKYTKKTYIGYTITTVMPAWLKKERWKPAFFLKSDDKTRALAIDIIPSGTIPQFQYTTIVSKLLADHSNFRVIIITLEESYEDNPEIEKFCIDLNIGL